MKTYDIFHVNRSDFDADRRLNELGSKRPPESVLAGRIEAESTSRARRAGCRQFPAPEGWFVCAREVGAEDA